MSSPSPGTTARLSPNAMRALLSRPFVKHSIETDQDFLANIRLVVPASIAGRAEWVGDHEPKVFVRWAWYYDDARRCIEIAPHSIMTNAVLVNASGEAIDAETTRRMVRRLLRRNMPGAAYPIPRQVRQPVRIETSMLEPARPEWAPQTLDPHDGTQAWAANFVSTTLTDLPPFRHFPQLSKALMEHFGFATITAIGRSRINPNVLVVEDNHVPPWKDLYRERGFAATDPRIAQPDQPVTWNASAPHQPAPDFWPLALEHGMCSGWSWTSADGATSLILSRADDRMSRAALAGMEANLLRLAGLIHGVLVDKLSKADVVDNHAKAETAKLHARILEGLRQGLPQKAIANHADISPSTLTRMLQQMRKEAGVESTADLLRTG